MHAFFLSRCSPVQAFHQQLQLARGCQWRLAGADHQSRKVGDKYMDDTLEVKEFNQRTTPQIAEL